MNISKKHGKTRFPGMFSIMICFSFIAGIIVLVSCSSRDTLYNYGELTEKTNDMEKNYNADMDANSAMEGTEMEFSSLVSGGDKKKSLDTSEQAKPSEPDERMKVYFGYLHLRVDNVKQARSDISTLTDEVGGYVESSYENTIIIRIPKELFYEILAQLMDMGEVLNKSIETYDVTEMFQDLAARLEIAKKTRNRLYALLEKTTDVKERLKILKEIRRLSEEIEKTSVTLENIKRLISFSRITISLEQRLSDLSYEDKTTIPFPWIASLDPFYVSLHELKGKVKMELGDEFAVFDKTKYFFAESTEGVRIRIATTQNTPKGDAVFWQQALEYNLSRFYKETEYLQFGEFKAVRFLSKDADPFTYIVGVTVKGKKIHVCEVLFPDRAAYDELGEAVKGYSGGCKIK